ncbi:hypothetical protein NIES2104_01180 [Leptolyngbya sp. NIES-2104]|nr:hypothetical protein NIES2104_01180 [Leptolyngbya sp. NIES-2104]
MPRSEWIKRHPNGDQEHCIVQPKLVIRADQQKYEIEVDDEGIVSKADLEQIAIEIGKWLNLPVTRTSFSKDQHSSS